MANNVLDPTASTPYWNTVTMSGVATVDSLLSPYKWGNNTTGASVTDITYSFPGIGAVYSTNPSTGYGSGPNEFTDSHYGTLSANERAIVREVFALISSVANIQFVETTDTASGVGLVRIGKTTFDMGDSTAGYAYEPGPDPINGDVWINTDLPSNPTDAVGSTFQRELFLHEILHALGLKHPFESSGTSTTILNPSLDAENMTVMSYNIAPGLSAGQYGIDVYPTTLMPLDIAALQYMYGANTTTNSGNTTYTFNYTDKKWAVVYDTGGTDTIACNAQSAVNVNLNAGTWSLVSSAINYENASGGTSSYTSTLYIQPGSLIENLIGGSAGDTLTGNALNNRIDGGSGNDSITGGSGNDTVIGGAGEDLLIGLAGIDAVFGGTGTDVLQVALASSQASLIKLRSDAFVLRTDSNNIELARNIEQVSFNGQIVNLSSQALYGNVDQTLAQIYVAAFKRAPEVSGYNYWAQEVAAKGISTVSDIIFSLDIVKQIYPASMAGNQFVTAIYQNVFNRAPDTEGLNYWTGQLNAKSRGQLVIDMTNAAMNVPDGTDGKDYFQNRVDWATYAVGYQKAKGMEITPDHLSSLTNTVNADPFTALTLIGQAESGATI